MNRKFVALGVLFISASAVLAQSDPVAERKATMKKAGAASAEIGKILKGDAPFDQSKVQASFKTIIDVSKTMPTLFTESSKTGDTRALPKIWESKADVDARYAKLGKEAEAALTSVKDEASLKTAFAPVNETCNGCHDTYRAKRN